MSWDAVSAVAESLGALGVIITVAYLALQIRQNTRTVRSAAQQSMFDNVHSLRLVLCQDPELASLLIKANESFDSLTAEEDLRFQTFAGALFGEWENIFLQNSHSVLAPEMWQAWELGYRNLFESPAMRRVWLAQKGQHLRSFQDHVEAPS
jgi:hypothetical protein